MTKSNHTPLLVKDGTHLCEKSEPGFIHVIGEAVSLDEFDEIDIHNHKQGQTTFLQMACPIQLSKEEWIALIVHRVNNWDMLVEALKPFLTVYEKLDSDISDSELDDEQPKVISITLGDLKKAYRTLALAKEGK